MKVLKFGGSSVAHPDRILALIDILKGYYSRGEKFTVVFSAFGGVTDSLIRMAELAAKGDESYLPDYESFSKRHLDTCDTLITSGAHAEVRQQLQHNHEVLKNLLLGIFLVRECSPRTMDYVLSFGERNSAYIISYAMREAGITADYLDARKIIKTDKIFGSARVDFFLTEEKIRQYYKEHPNTQVVTGFVASAKGGLTTTLGRGGSDYTASILAASLNAEAIEIWTDVDGVLTADPRRVTQAFTIPRMTYAEAMEMSHFGAKVIYPPTLKPAMLKEIPLYIKNTFNPDFPGTHISSHSDSDGHPVKGISSISGVALLTLSGSGLFGTPGVAGRLFSALANAGINIILITQGSSENAISFAIKPSFSERAKSVVEKAFEYEMERGLVDPIKTENDLSVVAIIGENMRYRPGISGRLFDALGKNGINAVAIAQGSSELNVSVVINRQDEAKALGALHNSFFLSGAQELNVFMVGVGLIGGTLLRQLHEQSEYLREERGLNIRVCGLANSKKMVFDPNGIDLADWKNQLDSSEAISDVATFVQEMRKMNLVNSVFVDNTANPDVASHYASILDASISVSTPNKVAASSSFLQYQRLKNIAKKRGVLYAYETNVGAGLPIITTLNDLITSGDQILKIEGVLSGSLSFIFNHYGQAGYERFVDTVRAAQKLGYTEPDPREDLSGKDVSRKILILAREAGLHMEAEDIQIEGILPEACLAAKTVEDFYEELEKAEAHFASLLQSAQAKDEQLCMAASLQDGKAKVGLLSVGADHPFASLSGSDNMVVFTTARYKERPLVVRGPGAGAEVTAAGVFAEIVQIGKFLS